MRGPERDYQAGGEIHYLPFRNLMSISEPSNQSPIQAMWLRVPQAVQLTGLSRSKIYELLTAGAIRSASLRDPGQRHATRLIDRADLLAFIERHVETR